MNKKTQNGFSLLELLITVAVIGIIAAIAVPNLLNAINRGKQKRTMADMRTIATAIESYNVDNATYPNASSVASLSPTVAPVYLDVVPPIDGWGRSYGIDSTAMRYTVWSGGSDGGALSYVGGPMNNFADSIVFSNGRFAQWPEGQQNN